MPTEFEDRFAIRELIDRWSNAVNERDWALLGTCFTEDGVWDVGAPYNATILGNVPGLISAQSYVIQTPHAVTINLQGDTATARSTIQEVMRGPDGSGMQMWGTYYDDLLRTDAGWRFTRRRYSTFIFEAKPPPGEVFRRFDEPA
jgi:ketosteroid isomerase-like protein